MPPGQPHLLARRVECDGQAGQHPIARPNRVVLQKHLRLGIDERRCVAMGDRHALRYAGRARRENDPGVIARYRRRHVPAARRTRAAGQTGLSDDTRHGGFAEHQLCPLLRVVGIHRHVRRAGSQHREDRHVQRVAPRWHPDSDPVSSADPARGQPPHTLLEIGDHLGVGQLDGAVVDAGGVRVSRRGGIENVDQCSRRRGLARAQISGRDLGHRHGCES